MTLSHCYKEILKNNDFSSNRKLFIDKIRLENPNKFLTVVDLDIGKSVYVFCILTSSKKYIDPNSFSFGNKFKKK